MEHQWKESYHILAVLFAEDIPTYTVFTVNQMLRSHLRFQSWYDLEWISVFAQEVKRFIQEGHKDKVSKLPDEANGRFADAPFGVGSLVGGVIELRNSLTIANDTGEKAKYLVYALDRFIVSEISNYWDKVYPEDVKLRDKFSSKETSIKSDKDLLNDSDRERLYRGIDFLKQPEGIGYRAARLLSVVDEIELMLNK